MVVIGTALLCLLLTASVGRNNPFVALFCFSLISLVITVTENTEKNFLKPTVIFPIFFYMYSTWYTYYAMATATGDPELLAQSLSYALVALIAFWAGSILVKKTVFCYFRHSQPRTCQSPFAERWIFYLCIVLSLSAMLFVYRSGFTSKREIKDAGTIYSVLITLGLLLATTIVFLRFARNAKCVTTDRFGITLAAICILAFSIGGERDYLIRLLMGAMCIWFDRRRKATTSIMLSIAFATAVAMPIMQIFKAFLLAPGIPKIEYALESFFWSDFTSASRNLYTLIEASPDQSWSFLFSDIARGLLPFGGHFGLQSSGAWYNAIFRWELGIEGSSGWGFGLAAQGYLIANYTGICLVFLIVGAFLSWLYEKRFKSEYWYAFYLLSLTTSIYCIRADVANFLSQTFKIGGVAILSIYLVNSFFDKIERRYRLSKFTTTKPAA